MTSRSCWGAIRQGRILYVSIQILVVPDKKASRDGLDNQILVVPDKKASRDGLDNSMGQRGTVLM